MTELHETRDEHQAGLLRLYVDDSGNTGPDLLATQQPVGITAMLLLDDDQERAISEAIARSRAQAPHRLPPELKFARISRTGQGRRVLRDAMAAVQATGAKVFFGVTEKRYLAASLVVETFLDPLWTDGLPIAMLSPVERRKAANLVYQACDDGILGEFLAATRCGDQTAVVVAGRRVASRLALFPAEEAPHVSTLVEHGLRDPFNWSKVPGEPALLKRPTAHTFTFVAVLSTADMYLRGTGGLARMIADEDAQFGPILDGAFKIGQRSDLFPSGVGPYGIPGPISRIRDRIELQSHASLGIQVADLAAGLIAGAARADLDGADLEHLGESWAVLLAALTATAPSSYWQVSERTLSRLTRSFDGLVPTRDGWWWSSL